MSINEQLSFSVSFGGNVKASATATINDTSVSVSGSVTFSKTTNVSGTISEVDEDESIVYII